MSEWATKKIHGLHWGHWQHINSDPRIHKDNFVPVFDITTTNAHQMCIKFGNEWASKPEDPFYDRAFQHPRLYPHDNWYFWDNPEVPQFLWRNPANPAGSKDWVRWVKSSLFTTPELHNTNGASRCNDLLKEFSKGRITAWHEIAKCKPFAVTSAKRVLICPVSANNYPNYYNTTQTAWVNLITQRLDRLGYAYDIRYKPGRKERATGKQLTDQLSTGAYCATVSQHSVAAVESIMAGVPAVVTGPHPAGNLATPWEEFEQGHLRTPELIETVNWIETLLGNVRHKRELFEGEWKNA